MKQQTIVAHFESRDKAEEARDALIAEGVADEAVLLYPEMAPEGYSRSVSSYDAARDEGGFWASLAKLFLPDRDRYAYSEGMSRGGATLSVTIDAANVESVLHSLERSGALDMDEQETKWRENGWTGYAAADGAAAASTSPLAGERPADESVRTDMATAGASPWRPRR